MLVKQRKRLVFMVIYGLFAYQLAKAGEDSIPDLEFLDYLGSWDESDEDWPLMVETGGVRKPQSTDERIEQASPDKKTAETEIEQ